MAHVLHAINAVLVGAGRVWGTVAPLRVSTTWYIKRWDAINVMPCVNMRVCIASRNLYEPFTFQDSHLACIFCLGVLRAEDWVGMLAVRLSLPNTPDT